MIYKLFAAALLMFSASSLSAPSIGPVGEAKFDAAPGVADIPSSFDPTKLLAPSWKTGKLAEPFNEEVGAFRFHCEFGQILADDPIMYPGQPGKSHLHAFFGNTRANAHSTYDSLRKAGDSSCEEHPGHPGMALNRSAYWAPAMLDGAGHVVVPDNAGIYYKRRPISDPRCSLTSGDPKAEGNCVSLPNGLRFIFGYDMLSGKTPDGSMWWNCGGQTSANVPGQSDHYPTIAAAAAHCPTGVNPDGSHNYILAVIAAPNCWDGKNLDSPNHRDHMSYEENTGFGFFRCPASHPYVVPSFVLSIAYTVDENLGKWHLSSDEMHPELPAGSTLHSDWFGAWDNPTEAMWMDNCINKKLNCSGGDLGNGKQINGGWLRARTGPRLVPDPRS